VVGLVAIGVLLLVLNWFFHRVYWTEHISRFHMRRRRLLGLTSGSLFSAQVFGFVRGSAGFRITPVDIDPPYWTGLWLGIFPTVETIGAQIAAALFVVGSYVLAERLRTRGRRRVAPAARRPPPRRSPPTAAPTDGATATRHSPTPSPAGASERR
jgi:hypothetical protein